MALIGMSEAARRAGVTTDGIRRALQNAGVPLVEVTARAYAVEETDLQAFLDSRGKLTPGRPRKVKSKGED